MPDRDLTLGPADAAPERPSAAGPDESRRVPLEREGQYTRLDELGRGGQSVVRRAVDEFVGRLPLGYDTPLGEISFTTGPGMGGEIVQKQAYVAQIEMDPDGTKGTFVFVK